MKKPKMPSLVTIAVLTLVTILFWVVFGILRIIFTKPNIKIPAEILEQVNPTLDQNTLNKVGERLFFEEGQIPKTQIATSSPTPVAFPIATASSSASPTPTATASARPTP